MSVKATTRRGDYGHFLTIPTRWMDNDLYGHVNNVIYYSYFDTVIADYLIHQGGLDIHTGPVIGVCAESSCRFHDSFAFPEAIEAGLGIEKLSARAAIYRIGLFKKGAETPAAEGRFVHVFVDRKAMRPVEIPQAIRDALEKLA